MAPWAPLVTFIGSGVGLAREVGRHRQLRSKSIHDKNTAVTDSVKTLPLSPIDERVYLKSSLADSVTQEVQLNTHQGVDEKDPLPKPIAPAGLTVHEEIDGRDPSPGLSTQEKRDETKEIEPVELVQSSDYQHSIGSGFKGRMRLTNPVILPQRRPRWKERGFIQAYAPALEQCGIDEEKFLQYLSIFNQVREPSAFLRPLEVLLVGPAIALVVCLNFLYPVMMVPQVALEIIREIQARRRTTAFLKQINEELLTPNGLFGLILTYKPDQKNPGEPIDINQAILEAAVPAGSRILRFSQSIRTTDGITYGEPELPKAASLVFPFSDERRNVFMRMKLFVSDYYDKRAKARYAHRYPNSSLNVDPKTLIFVSRYSDPNHPANNGSIFSFVTGGHLNSKEMRARRRQRQQQREELRGTASYHDKLRRKRRSAYRNLKSKLTPNARYLIIVNLPTAMELEAAMEVRRQEARKVLGRRKEELSPRFRERYTGDKD